MLTKTSYNIVIERFKAFADGHYLIRRFSHGQIDVTDIVQENEYPWMHVVPVSMTPSDGSMSYEFDVVFADLPRDKETPTEYQRESLSDCIRLAEDLISEIKNGGIIFGTEVTLEGGTTIEPFIEEYTHTLTGVNCKLSMTFPNDWSACEIPADWSAGGSGSGGSGGGGTGLVLKVNGTNNVVQSLLDLVEGSNITITDLGDGRVEFNASGDIGATWGTITGVLSSQTDLQETLDLKADITSLGAVAFSNDYNDLDNLPTIPVNLDDLGDVNAPSPSNGQVLTYNTTTSEWEPVTPSGGGGNQDLQSVTDIGNTTTNDLLVQGANDFVGQVSSQVISVYNTVTGAYAEMSVNTGGQLVLSDGSTAGILSANNLNGNVQLEFPDKTTGTYTIATTDDITTQVNADWDATSGVAEILNKPTIPAAQVNSDWNAVSGVEEILNKPTLAAVATSGDYNDLDNLPTIPTNLDDLGDVNAPTPSNGQVLTYNSTSGDWEAATPSTGTGTVESVALTMPSAFSVAGSPVTTIGTLAVTGAGTTDQYIRGDGTLANFPATGGGGGQVFYFNGNVSQPSIGGNAYYELGTAANTGPAANFTRATTGVIARFITDIGSPNHLIIPSGVWTIDVYLSETGGGANHAQILAKLYTYNGSTFTLIATSTMEEITNGNVPDLYTFTISVPNTTTLASDRIHIEFDIQNTNGKTVTLYTEASRIGEVHTTYAIGLSSLNGLTDSTQTFAVGTAGTNFAINSASSVHTFNLPTASASNRGALSSTDWSTFNGKQNSVGFTDVGTALATIPNPSATRYLRINSNNSVTAITASTLKSELLAGTPYGVVAYGSAFVNFVPASTTTYGTITSGIIAFNTTIANREFTIPFGGTVKNLYVHTSTQQAAGGSLVISIMQNQINTALSITIPALGVAAVRTNLTDTFTAVAGDKLVFRLINNHTNVSATIVSVSFIIEQL